MADLLDKKPVEHTTPVAPEKQRIDLRPRLRRPPAPRIYRWIQWMALFVVLVAAAVTAAILLRGDEEVAAYDRGAEHGEYTALAVRDLSGVDLESRFAGLDPIFDPAVVPEHGEFTVMVYRDLTGVNLNRLSGLDANLDRDVILGAGYHTVMPARWGVVKVERYAGLDISPEAVAPAPDALDRYLWNNPPVLPAPDALDRYLASN